MRYYTDKAIKTGKREASRLYSKLANMRPTEHFTTDDITMAMFIVNQYKGELESIERDRRR